MFQGTSAMIAWIFILSGLWGAVLSTSVIPSPGTDYRLSPENKLYKLHPEPLMWDLAEKVCVEEGGHLAVIDSERESNFLTNLMVDGLSEMNTPVALLGFSRGTDRQFTTILGKPLGGTGFQRWSNTGPELSGLKGGNCGSLHRDGGLSRFPCHQQAAFLCEKQNEPTTTTPTPSTTPVTRPASGYELLAGLGWYKLHGDIKIWHDAVKACEAENSHLAVLNSDAEAMALKNLMSRHREINFGVCQCAFIGFHDLSKEGFFITVFDEPLEKTGFLKWGPGNPDNTGNNEDCGAITYRGDLNDLSCIEKYPFICEHSTNTVSYNKSVNAKVTQYQSVYENFPNVGSYKLHTEGKRWQEAADLCEAEGAYLAVVNSNDESDVLRKIIGRNPDLELGEKKTVFIGFRAGSKADNFTTILGQPLNSTGYIEWAPKNQRTSEGSLDCGAIDRNGRLNAVNCLSTAPFLCEKLSEDDRTKNLVNKQGTVQGTDYELHPGLGYYKLSSEKATWHVAKKKCEEEGAYLAIINSFEESNLLRNIVSRNTQTKLHSSILLGFHDITTEGQFVTIFGVPLGSTGFDSWAAWNPDNFGRGEDCGAMDHEGYLNDVPCDMKLQYFCERGLNSTGKKNAFEPPRRMTITPDHLHVRQGSQVSVMCHSEEPLVECHFKLTNRPVFDLSLGSASKTNFSLLEQDIASYKYNGSGLANGDCGIVLTLGVGLHRKTVGCRGRGVHGGWMYAFMSLQASNSPAIDDLTTPPPLIVTREGDQLQLVWQAKTPLTACKFILPGFSGETVFSDPYTETENTEYVDSYEDESNVYFGDNRPSFVSQKVTPARYHGLGFKSGQCGIELVNPDMWNGYVWCGLGAAPSWEWRSAAIIVSEPPNEPVLEMNSGEHSEGAILEAECTVSGSRPVSNITWYMGDDVIRQDAVDDSPSTAWTWPYDRQTITQKITRQLKLSDNGKELICEAGHEALPAGTLRTKRVINIEGSLLNRTFDVEEYGFVVGRPGFISIVITASPKPTITWHFDNITIKEGGQDATGRFVASTAVKLNSLSIHWVVKLFISNVTEEDFTRDFYLTSKNEFGAQAYKIVIAKSRPTRPPYIQPVTQEITTRPTTRPWTTPKSPETRAPTTTPWTTPVSPRKDVDVSTSGPQTTRLESTTPQSTQLYTTQGPEEPSATVTSGWWNTTSEYTEYSDVTSDFTVVVTEATEFQENAVPENAKTSHNDWKTSGAIAGIVIAILIVHLTLAAVMIYGRRSGWWCIPRKARRHFAPSMSMDNLVDEEEAHH